MSNFTSHLKTLLPDTRLSLTQEVLPILVSCLVEVAQALRSAGKVSQVGSTNAHGDEQLNVDLIAEKVIRSAVAKCPAIASASSEEDPVERRNEAPASTASESAEKYCIAFDPLDGSSIIAPNWTVGTIIGIWDGETALRQNPKEKQIAAILGVFGPRTTATIALRVPGSPSACFDVALGDNGSVEIIRPTVQLKNAADVTTRYFAPANLRAAAEDEKYMNLISHFITHKYTLRYSGGLVPDVIHALVKGHGVYMSPVTGVSKAKLRRLYELAPVALIVECAGGMAVDEQGRGVLEREIAHTEEKAGLICGSREEVEFVRRQLGLE
ncbi:sedoheptulose-1,7-bisphosphatase [Massariosphaeria phaeospora]|uniref:Sedoheptulose-1,7-bisphosphatase n=1 Tax=Massariosphaeria phaeospora TaxID=100035 RepID=A0A7C8IK97_9PLEO|nr:sedoheptulose-1,7-bisphosphatase [Massariosphaeria phaeospora]